MTRSAHISDDDVVVVRPVAALEAGALDGYLRTLPAARREGEAWVLPMDEAQVGGRFSTRVVWLADGEIGITPGDTDLGRARARGVVQWLLSHGPAELTAGGIPCGVVDQATALYAEPWLDPDLDPTDSPPRDGRLVQVVRGFNFAGAHFQSGNVGFMRQQASWRAQFRGCVAAGARRARDARDRSPPGTRVTRASDAAHPR